MSEVDQLAETEEVELAGELPSHAIQSPASGRIAFRVVGLDAGFGEKKVLDGVDLEIERGLVTVLLGTGGSGKSTLLGLLIDPSGAGVRSTRNDLPLWVEGTVERPGSPLGVQRQRIEHDGTVGTYFGASLAETGGSPNDEKVRARIRTTWACAPGAAAFLDTVWETPIASLGAGHRRLIGLSAVASRDDLSLLLLDEPTADQQPEEEEWTYAQIHRLRTEPARDGDREVPRTLVIVTHNLRLAKKTADAVALLIDGRLIEKADVESFFERPVHERTAYFVRMGC